MPIQLSKEVRADPTRALTLIEKPERKASRFVLKFIAAIKKALREQDFGNKAMTPLQFLRFVDRLAEEMNRDEAVWTEDLSAAAYGQGRNFSSIVLGAPLEVRQQAWRKTGLILEKGKRAFAKMTDSMSADVRRVISEQMLREGSQKDMIGALEDLAQTYEYQARRIVRTETMEAVNSGVMDGYRAHDVEKVEWLAAEGCCPKCQERDGHVYAIDSGVHAPLHPNCRCTVIPVIDVPGREVREPEPWEED